MRIPRDGVYFLPRLNVILIRHYLFWEGFDLTPAPMREKIEREVKHRRYKRVGDFEP